MNGPVCVSKHPLVLDKLTRLRDRRTEAPEFRQLVSDLSQLLFYEASQDIDVTALEVETPLAKCAGHAIRPTIGFMPILRAGLGMVEPILAMLPTAQVWHLGLYRDHETLKPVTYYNKLPPQPTVEVAFVLDPMLATGGSAVAAMDILKRWGVQRIKFLGLIAAPEGVETLRKFHPEVPMHLGAIDSHLNERSYIVPGLGDAGDRQFHTAGGH
jgi:uracil phosphoribosyltransferase